MHCVDTERERAEAIAQEVKGAAVVADVTKRAGMQRIFDEAHRLFGGSLQGVVDIVGLAQNGPLSAIRDAKRDWQFVVVLRHACLAIQIGDEALTFIGSFSGLQSIAGQAA